MARTRLTSAQRREQILRSAVAVFGRKGFAGSTTRALAREAGVSEAMIFRFFPDKASLYRAIIDRFIAASGDPFPRGAAARGDVEGVLAGLAENLMRSVEDDPCFLRLLLHSALEEHDLSRLFLEARVLKVTRALARYLRARMQAGALRPLPPVLAARTFLSMPTHYVLLNTLYGRAMPGRLPRHSAARLFASLFLDGLGAAREGSRRAVPLRQVGA